MKNVNLETKGNILTIKVDLSERHGKSSSGKTVIIATTEGNADIDGFPGVKLGLNIYTKEGK